MIESSGLRHFEAKELLIQNMEVLFYVTVAVYIFKYTYRVIDLTMVIEKKIKKHSNSQDILLTMNTELQNTLGQILS